MQLLKSETAAQHKLTEQSMSLESITSKESYKNLLERLYGFYKPLEPKLHPYASVHLKDWSERQKTNLIARDLRGFGHKPKTLDALDNCTSFPNLRTLESILGCLYVLEGSTLGGQIISRCLKRQGIAENQLHFFSSYRETTGQKWKAFAEQLEALEPDPQMTISAASETFNAYARWMSKS